MVFFRLCEVENALIPETWCLVMKSLRAQLFEYEQTVDRVDSNRSVLIVGVFDKFFCKAVKARDLREAEEESMLVAVEASYKRQGKKISVPHLTDVW